MNERLYLSVDSSQLKKKTNWGHYLFKYVQIALIDVLELLKQSKVV